MSINLARIGRLEPPSTTLLTTTDPTQVVAGTDKHLRCVESISIVNTNAAARTVTLTWVDAGPASFKFWHKSVPGNDTIIEDSLPIILDGKGKVREVQATASNANDISITVVSSALDKQTPLPTSNAG